MSEGYYYPRSLLCKKPLCKIWTIEIFFPTPRVTNSGIMPRVRYAKTGVKKTFKKRVKKAVTRARKTAFQKKVVGVLRNASELKQKTTLLTLQASGAQNVMVPGNGLLPGTDAKGFLIPNVYDQFHIGQGTNQQQRVGNALSPQSFTLRGYLVSNGFNETHNSSLLPFEVYIIVYRAKNDPTGQPDKLKMSATNDEVPVDGTAGNSMSPWNRAKYQILKVRRFKMRPLWASIAGPVTLPVAPGNTGTTALPANANVGAQNNPMFQRFMMKIPLPSQLKYADQGNTPLNHWFSVGCYVINGNGVQFTPNQSRASVYMSATMTYRDL
mgnify:CR=1 FL=1